MQMKYSAIVCILLLLVFYTEYNDQKNKRVNNYLQKTYIEN
jgi:hypothetical protein